jgi:PKD repeat protein
VPLIDPSDASGGGGGGTVSVEVNVYPTSLGELQSGGFQAASIYTTTLTLGANESDFTLDLAAEEKTLEALRDAFKLGYSQLAVTFTATSGTATIGAPKAEAGQGLSVIRRAGATAMLLDDVGRVIEEDFNHHDLRHLPAGTYYLGVSRTTADTMSDPLAVNVSIAAPHMGAVHVTDDNDRIRGGDGDDVLVGGDGRNQLWGDSGDNVFVGEFFEPRDRQSRELLLDNLAATAFSDSRPHRVLIDPRVQVGAGDLPDHAIRIADPALAQVIADGLGVRLIERDGEYSFADSLHATDLAGITVLDASGIGLTSPSSNEGFEYLIGLETLDLRDNELRAGVLNRLLPADAGRLGTPHLHHLNLDGNRIGSTANLAGMFSLRVLSLADQDNANFTNLDGLENLSQLVYLNVSGNEISDVSSLTALGNLRAIDISANPVTDLRPLGGSVVVEPSLSELLPAGGWLYSIDPFAIGGASYLGTPMFGTAPRVDWTDVELPRGQFEVLATWHADSSHDDQVEYELRFGGSNESVLVNQRIAPEAGLLATRTFGGQTFALLDTIEISEDRGVLTVVTTGSGDGIVVADAWMIRSVDLDENSLRRIDARGTRLDTASRSLIAADLMTRQVIVEVDDDSAPIWSGLPTKIAMDTDEGFDFGDLNDFAQDPDGTELVFSIVADHPSLALVQAGSVFKLATTAAVDRPIQVLLEATDAGGLSSTVPITVVAGGSPVSGQVSSESAPVQGVVVFADLDRNKKLDLGEPFAVTRRDGSYDLQVPNQSTFTVRTAARSDLAGEPSIEVNVDHHDVVGDIDLRLSRVQILLDEQGTPGVVAEGTELTASYEPPEGLADVQWTIAAGNGEPLTSNKDVFQFTPRQPGVHVLSLSGTLQGQPVSTTRELIVTGVPAIATAGEDLVISEGRWVQTRTVIDDPGQNVWQIKVDYGDRSPVVIVEQSSSRDFTFDHLYRAPGEYTVTVSVTDEFGTTSDSLLVTVAKSEPEIVLGIDEPFHQGGAQGGLDLTILDDSGLLDRFRYRVVVDWGDGVSEDATELLNYHPDGSSANETLSHAYQDEGERTIVVSVIDPDGLATTASITVVVQNDVPRIAWNLPTELLRGEPAVFVADVRDSDPITSIEWDFGDGSEVRMGASVTHAYAEPGVYQVSVTATDADGDSRTRTATVQVSSVNRPPVVTGVSRQVITETIPWSFVMIGSDPDAGDQISWTVRDAPSGLTIDDDGLIQWTPTAEQGPASYQFDVLANDSSGAQTVTLFRVDVVDTSIIQGQIFDDLNGNGFSEANEPDLSGITIALDRGDNGVIDQTVPTDEDGNFRFEGLPLGYYRVTVVGDFELTTPGTFRVDLNVPRYRSLPSIGIGGDLQADTDGDGVSDFDELNSIAGIDGNGDGIPDWQQAHVASFATPGGAVTLVSPSSTSLREVALLPAIDSTSANRTFPHGRIAFEVEGLAAGGIGQVEMIWHGATGISAVFMIDESRPEDEIFRRLGEAADESIFFHPQRVALELTDGSAADLDGIVDGRLRFDVQPARIHSAWQNQSQPFDVNDDGDITPLDVLLIINAISRRTAGMFELPENRPDGSNFYDVNGDGRLTPLDVLLVINELNRRAHRHE